LVSLGDGSSFFVDVLLNGCYMDGKINEIEYNVYKKFIYFLFVLRDLNSIFIR